MNILELILEILKEEKLPHNPYLDHNPPNICLYSPGIQTNAYLYYERTTNNIHNWFAQEKETPNTLLIQASIPYTRIIALYNINDPESIDNLTKFIKEWTDPKKDNRYWQPLWYTDHKPINIKELDTLWERNQELEKKKEKAEKNRKG